MFKAAGNGWYSVKATDKRGNKHFPAAFLTCNIFLCSLRHMHCIDIVTK